MQPASAGSGAASRAANGRVSCSAPRRTAAGAERRSGKGEVVVHRVQSSSTTEVVEEDESPQRLAETKKSALVTAGAY